MIKFTLVLLFQFSMLAGFANDDPRALREMIANEPEGEENLAYQWGKVALTATANDTEKFNPRPTITSRYLALIFTSMFDAWSRYDEKAVPDTFLCPPFPGYVSGHSAVSSACGEALNLFTGSDKFGLEVKLVAGALTQPDNPGEEVTLKFPTFTKTIQMAGISRVLGGYHIQADNIAGIELGKKIEYETWKFYNKHIGTSLDKSDL